MNLKRCAACIIARNIAIATISVIKPTTYNRGEIDFASIINGYLTTAINNVGGNVRIQA